MMKAFFRRCALAACACLMAVSTSIAGPTAEQALKLTPVQSGVNFDAPTAKEIAKCTIDVEKSGKASGWLVKDADGLVLRRFRDTNGDNVVDQWCYYQSGLEVYRDIDSDFNGKADQFRWLGPEGTRWAIDKDEDGKIDHWKQISAEEVSAEVVRAVAEGSLDRYRLLSLTEKDIDSLGVSAEDKKQLQEKVRSLHKDFSKFLSEQKQLDKDAGWVRFDALRPGVIPAGTDGSTKDVTVYENVVALVESQGEHRMMQIGTLIRVDGGWKVIDVPRVFSADADEVTSSGFFFRATPNVGDSGPSGTLAKGGSDEEIRTLLNDLEKLDTTADAATPAAQAKYNRQRADILEKLVDKAGSDEDRSQWVRQLADTISVAAQSGQFPEGVERLRALVEKVEKADAEKELLAYVKFRHLMADYGSSLQSPNADFAKVQTRWLERMESFVEAYPESPDAAEALLQLGVAQELAGQEEKAKEWYTAAATRFPETPPGKKAAGAKRRLDSVGKPLKFVAKDFQGRTIDLSRFRGRVVLIDYWATWCEPCKESFKQLKELNAKYGSAGFTIIGVNLDNTPEEAKDYLSKNRLPWYHVYEEGGLESRLANELGILTLPTKILIDKRGNVVDRNIHISHLEDELKKLLRSRR